MSTTSFLSKNPSNFSNSSSNFTLTLMSSTKLVGKEPNLGLFGPFLHTKMSFLGYLFANDIS